MFAATVVAVAVTALLGRKARRRAHFVAAAVSAGLLVWAIYLAETLGRTLLMPRGPLLVHLVFANAGAVAFLTVVATGVRLARTTTGGRRRWHRRAVVAFLLLVVAAACTGTYMVLQAVPRPQ